MYTLGSLMLNVAGFIYVCIYIGILQCNVCMSICVKHQNVMVAFANWFSVGVG